MTNRRELAWAAGFFDGEGCIYVYSPTRPGRSIHALLMNVKQVRPEPLMRFQSAVGDIGRIYGPAHEEGRSPTYQWATTNWRDSQAVFAMLWPELSLPKREQIITKVREHRNTKRWWGTRCATEIAARREQRLAKQRAYYSANKWRWGVLSA